MSRLQDLDFKDLKEEDPVEFDVKEDPHGRGPRAVNVRSLRLRRKRRVCLFNFPLFTVSYPNIK